VFIEKGFNLCFKDKHINRLFKGVTLFLLNYIYKDKPFFVTTL